MALGIRQLLVFALALVALALALPGAASASGDDVLAECFSQSTVTKGKYSRQELRDALKQLEADGDNYSECRDIISGLLAPTAGAAGPNDAPSDAKQADSPGGGGGGSDGPGDNGGASESIGSASDPTGSADDGSGGSAKDQEKRQLARVDVEQQIGERAFDPRSGASIAGDTSNGLPLPVLLALIALTVLLAAGAVLAVHQRNPAFMGALRRVPLPRRRR